MEESQDEDQQPQGEISFDSLPFLFPDSWRPALLRWKKAAVERERELAQRRRARLQGLREYVRQRLEEIQVKEQLKAASVTDGDSDPPRLVVNQDQHGPTRDFPSAVSPPPNPQLTISTQQPRPFTQQPLPSTQHTLPSAQQLLPSTQHTLPSTQQLLPSTQQPHPSIQQPHPSTQLSLPTTQKQALLTSTLQPLPSTLPPPPSTHTSYTSPRRKLFAPSDNRASQTRIKTQDPYALVTAMARGFLTRRLLQAQKVRDVIKTIKEATSVLSTLATPTSQQDQALKERVSIQLQVAQRTLHEIFFTLPVEEQMAYIAHSRILDWEQRRRAAGTQQPYLPGGVARRRGEGAVRGRLSSATMKAIERRRQQEAAAGSRGTVVGGASTTSDQRRAEQKRLATASNSSRSQGGPPSSSRSQGGSSRSQGGPPSSSGSQGDSSRSQGGSSGSQGGPPSSSRSQGGSSRSQGGPPSSSGSQGDSSRSQGGSSGSQGGPPSSSRSQGGSSGSQGGPPSSSRSQGGSSGSQGGSSGSQGGPPSKEGRRGIVRNAKMADTSVSKSVRKAPKLAKPKKT